jgi:phosphate-selective porin OprO/OprP
MRTLTALLAASSALLPVAALAQEAGTPDAVASSAALLARIDAMQAEIERLSTEVETLRKDAAAPTAAPVAASAPASPSTPASAPGSAPATQSPPAQIAFKGAPEFTTDTGWSFKPRGRVMVDVGTFNAPDSTGRADGFGSDLRRARIGVEGKIPGGFGYRVEYDFAPGQDQIYDAYLTWKKGGLTLTAGQHNTFQSLEELSSSLFSSTIERAAFTDAFGFERRLGLSAQYAKGPLLVQAGIFTDNAVELPGKARSLDARIVLAPKMADTQLHFGASIHANDTADASVRYRQRPLIYTTSVRFIDTDTISARKELGLGAELAVIHGSFHAVAEGYRQKVDRPNGLPDPVFFGGYAEIGMFLTPGDRRGYRNGQWDRVTPVNPVDEGGMGALAINLRYDYLDLSDNGIAGGVQRGYLASLAWTPTDYTRLLINYGRLHYRGAIFPAAGSNRNYGVDSLGMRAQVDF